MEKFSQDPISHVEELSLIASSEAETFFLSSDIIIVLAKTKKQFDYNMAWLHTLNHEKYLSTDEWDVVGRFLVRKGPKLHIQTSQKSLRRIKQYFGKCMEYSVRFYHLKDLIAHVSTENIVIHRYDRKSERPIPDHEIPTDKLEAYKKYEVHYAVLGEDGQVISIAGEDRSSPTHSMIGVFTTPKTRKRGYATICAYAAILEILTLGKQPVYASDVLNIPSMRIAEKLGFIPHCDLLCGFLGPWKKMRGEEDDPAIPDSSFMI